MQRVRMSLPYFKKFGWDASVVIVDEKYTGLVKDYLLVQSLPTDLKIYRVKAFSKALTSKAGLGSLALRSLWFFFRAVNEILKREKFDLIYFSTTEFPVCTLGALWKKKFGVPYVIDMQDPWHSEYYKNKPREQRPPKYWFSYRLHKYLEPVAMKRVDGLISVSADYIADLKSRYPVIKDIPEATITFGAFEQDLEIAGKNSDKFKKILQPGFINVVYIGRGGMDMQRAATPVFLALKKGLQDEPALFKRLRFYFIGTSYAPLGTGMSTFLPVAVKYGVESNVVEITDRISYYHTLLTLQQADALFIPGSDDKRYTASKIYPYLLTRKPLMAIFNTESSAVTVIKECATNAILFTFDDNTLPFADDVYQVLRRWAAPQQALPVNLTAAFENYSAENLTEKQAKLFDMAIGTKSIV